jgi:hypothetical protein
MRHVFQDAGLHVVCAKPAWPVVFDDLEYACLQVFLVEIEYMRTGEVFSRLPTKSLPYIFHVQPQFSLEGDGPLKLTPRDVMQVRLGCGAQQAYGACGT